MLRLVVQHHLEGCIFPTPGLKRFGIVIHGAPSTVNSKQRGMGHFSHHFHKHKHDVYRSALLETNSGFSSMELTWYLILPTLVQETLANWNHSFKRLVPKTYLLLS